MFTCQRCSGARATVQINDENGRAHFWCWLCYIDFGEGQWFEGVSEKVYGGTNGNVHTRSKDLNGDRRSPEGQGF